MVAEMNLSDADTTAKVFHLGQDLTIADATDVQQRMLELLRSGGGDIQLDGGSLAQVDGAGIQLLAALANEAKIRGLKFAWMGASESLVSAARQLGLETLLHLPSSKS